MNIFLVQRLNYDAVLARYHSSDRIVRALGGVVERLMAPVLKTGRAQALVGSNPTPSASQFRISDFGLWIAGKIQRAAKYAHSTPINDAQTTSER
jgi:hypothetical protein